jgi:sugar (pentulose or hexulose) kinase
MGEEKSQRRAVPGCTVHSPTTRVQRIRGVCFRLRREAEHMAIEVQHIGSTRQHGFVVSYKQQGNSTHKE